MAMPHKQPMLYQPKKIRELAVIAAGVAEDLEALSELRELTETELDLFQSSRTFLDAVNDGRACGLI